MFPQPRKWPAVVAGIVVVLFLLKNPAGAAHAINHAWSAVNTFAGNLNSGH